jgi:hypothetical protein
MASSVPLSPEEGRRRTECPVFQSWYLEGFSENNHKLFRIKLQVIKLQIDLAILDPDPYWEMECGSGSRSKKIYHSLQINLISSLLKRLCTCST